jgi:hypothetical protein
MKPGLLDVNMPLALAPPMDKGRVVLWEDRLLGNNQMSIRRYDPDTGFSSLPMEMRTGPGLFGASRGITLASSFSTLIRWHEGVDLLGRNEDVYAAADGRVVTASHSGTDNTVEIMHEPIGARYLTRYRHLSHVIVHSNEQVRSGQTIGRVNDAADGSHLHFELRRMFVDDDTNASDQAYSEAIDPTPFLYRWEGANHFDNRKRQHETSPAQIRRIEQLLVYGVSYFKVTVKRSKDVYEIPIYAPTPEELSLIELLRLAFASKATVVITYRDSIFFGGDHLGDMRKVIIGVELRSAA